MIQLLQDVIRQAWSFLILGESASQSHEGLASCSQGCTRAGSCHQKRASLSQQMSWVHSASFDLDASSTSELSLFRGTVRMRGVAGPLPEAGWGVGFPHVGTPAVWEPGERVEAQEGARGQRPSGAPCSQQPRGSSRRPFLGPAVHEAVPNASSFVVWTPAAARGGGGWRMVSSTEADGSPRGLGVRS